MTHRNLFIPIFILAVSLALTMAGGGVAQEGTLSCPTVDCLYLPLVSNPPPVRVFEFETYGSREGNTQMVGEVVTTSDRPVYEVQLEFSLFDRSSEQIASSTGETILDASLPGRLDPFHVTTNFDWKVWDERVWRYEVKILRWTLESDKEYRMLTTKLLRTEEVPFQGARVDVEVHNEESIGLMDVYGVAWSLNQASSPLKRFISTCLAPGETAVFTEFLWGVQGVELNTIHAVAQGVVGSCEP